MKKTFCLAALCAFLLLPASTTRMDAAPARSGVYQPKPGSRERKAILDALRVPLSKVAKKKIIFRVHSLRVYRGWAFANVTALRPDGTRLGDDDLWGEAQGLLRKRGNRWRVLVSGFATDTSVYDEAKRKYPQAPAGIFAG